MVAALLRDSSCHRILDAGCGYGRIGVPLAEAGFDVVGVDVSPMMLEETRRRAELAGVPMDLRRGDLCELPCEPQDFDAVICMWLTFNELLNEADQLRALRELVRVLRPGGWILIDGPPYLEGEEDAPCEQPNEVSVSPAGADESLDDTPVGRRYAALMQSIAVTRYDLFVDDCPGRPRYFLRFWSE